jgi:DNA invertase Pin-like site-specific DNA recombinase
MIDLSWQDKIASVHRKFIYRLLRDGVSAKVLAKAFRVTEGDIEELRVWMADRRLVRVQDYLQWRVERELPYPPRKPPKHQKVPNEDHWLVYRRRKTGETYGSIAKTYGCSKTTIDHIVAKEFRRQKVRVWKYLERRAMRPKPKKASTPKAPTKDIGYRFIPKLKAGDAHKMLMLYKKVKNYAEVARAFGVSNTTATKVIRRAEKSQSSMVWFYLQKRRRRMYAWDARMQSMEFEMNRGEG